MGTLVVPFVVLDPYKMESDMKNFVQSGDVLTLIAPANVLGGALVVVGMICGVAQHDALAGAPVEVRVQGVYALNKVSAQAWTAGAAIYVVPASGLATTATTAGNILIGVAVAAAANPTSTGLVRLNGSMPAAATV